MTAARSVEPTAREIMTPLTECLSEDETLLGLARRLTETGAAMMPVLSRNGGILGWAMRADVVRAVAGGEDPATTPVTTEDVLGRARLESTTFTVRHDCSLDEMQSLMYDQGATDLLVKDAEKLIGIVTWDDLETFLYEAPDGLPLPPLELIRLVSGPTQTRRHLYEHFYGNGLRSAQNIKRILRRNGVRIEQCGSVLDFGCGCGRVMRHWQDLRGPRLYGSDYNPSLVEWCRESLPFAEFTTNSATPGLPFDDGSFDLVYVMSVFTHLDVDQQVPWMTELSRVTRPGGLLLLTVHGKKHLRFLAPEEKEAFLAGELVVRSPESSGTNQCAVFHPERYLRETLGAELDLLEHMLKGAPEMSQDQVLFRKPA